MISLNLSIIVVTYNCENYIEKFLNELKNSLLYFSDFQILINDNSSSDNTYLLCVKHSDSNISVFKTDNIGFAKANNLLIKRAQYDNILLLNPDVFGFNRNTWISLFDKWDKINPCFIRLLNEDLSIQVNVGDELSLKRYLIKFLRGYSSPSYSEKIISVQSGIMAFVLLTKDSLNVVGLISEKYYMYSEDHDWFIRAGKKGFKPQFIPCIKLIHIGGASAKSRWKKKEENSIKLKSERMLINEHFRGFERFVLLVINNIKKLINRFK